MVEKFQYQALNLMDEVSTVEVGVDYNSSSVHLLDMSAAIYPMFEYSTKNFIMNEEFLKMVKVLSSKQLISKSKDGVKGFRFEDYLYYFYTPNKPIRKLDGRTREFEVIQEENTLLQEFLLRVL